MATQDVEEYESDPEEVKRSLGMRRREAASDDEEDDEGEEKSRTDQRPSIHSEESDDQGGTADYDEDLEEEEEEVYEEEIYDDEEGGIDQEKEGERTDGYQIDDTKEVTASSTREVVVEGGDESRNAEQGVDEEGRAPEAEEEEKKENEPYAVPTAGAFYMHDDRFRAKGNLRPSRRTHGGRSLWESKDDGKWGHDKFEEMNTHERNYDEVRRGSRGRYQGCGKNRDSDRGYRRENSTRTRGFNDNDNQNQAPKGFRGRGPRRYDPSMKNGSQAPPSQNKQSRKPLEKNSHTNSGRAFQPAKNSHTNSGRAFQPAKNSHTDQAPTTKQVFASSLSSASPPFYPSGSSNKDVASTQKRDVQSGGSGGRNLRPSVTDESYHPVSQTLRGKNVVDSIGMNKLYIDDSGSATGKPIANQGTHFRAQGRGVAMGGQMAYQPVAPQIQASRSDQRNSVQSRVQTSVQAPSQGQRSGNSGSRALSPPKTASSTNSYEPGEMESLSESSKSKGALVGKGKGNGRGSFMYGGTQVMGSPENMAVGRGDQNFPAFLPVMQFAGQHPGGMGVPAVGMAFPGYVANPQLGGVGNSEMTWLPVLTGAAGPYCSPYFAMDGVHNTRPSGQTSSTGSSSKENNTNVPNNEWKSSSQRSEPVDEFVQQQNKQPRRYSEMSMSFDQ